jgi:hypothetical protein
MDMGKYDDISPERLRSDLVGFARFVLRLEEEGRILTSAAQLQKLLGELRQKLFAYEIRSSHLHLETPRARGGDAAASSGMEGDADPVVRDSLRVVREALRRTEEMLQEWQGTEPEDADDDE